MSLLPTTDQAPPAIAATIRAIHTSRPTVDGHLADLSTAYRAVGSARSIQDLTDLMDAQQTIAEQTVTIDRLTRERDYWRTLAEWSEAARQGRERYIEALGRRYQRLRAQRRRELAFLSGAASSGLVAFVLAALTAALLLAGPIISSLPIPGGW